MSRSQGKRRSVNAFAVALDQACGGGEKRWYTSTLELQLASLELCRACRRVPTLHSAAMEQWAGSLEEISFGGAFHESITGVEWPTFARMLSFRKAFNQPDLTLESAFNQPITGVDWPASSQEICVGDAFNQPMAGVVWPSSLRVLRFGFSPSSFNQPITGVEWPVSLVELSFGEAFNQPIVGVTWPASLQELSFGEMSLNGGPERRISCPYGGGGRMKGVNFSYQHLLKAHSQ
eukprot:g13165.t1